MNSELKPETRLINHITKLFNEFLTDNRSRLDNNNSIVDLRNIVIQSIKNLFAESDISRKLGLPIDSLSLISFSNYKSSQLTQNFSPSVPYDLIEAEKLDLLLSKINEFKEKFRIIQEECGPLAQQMSRLHGRWHSNEIEGIIYRAFFIELENRPHQKGDMSKIWASIKTQGVIRNRNIPCEICGENRRTEKCHIIPNALGGNRLEGNILILCPAHHSLLDSHMLSKEEWDCIKWSRKNEMSQLWAKKVLLIGHSTFWEQQLPSRPQTTIDFGNHQPFAADLAIRLVNLLHLNNGLLQKDIYKYFDPNIRIYMRKVIKTLIIEGIIKRKPEKRNHQLFIDNTPTILNDIIIKLHFKF